MKSTVPCFGEVRPHLCHVLYNFVFFRVGRGCCQTHGFHHMRIKQVKYVLTVTHACEIITFLKSFSPVRVEVYNSFYFFFRTHKRNTNYTLPGRSFFANILRGELLDTYENWYMYVCLLLDFVWISATCTVERMNSASLRKFA